MDTSPDPAAIRFDGDAIQLGAPPDGAGPLRIAWDQITRVGFRSGRWPAPGELWISTDAAPDGLLISLDADGAQALWAAIRARGLLSDALARQAAAAPDELVCSPRRPHGDVTQAAPPPTHGEHARAALGTDASAEAWSWLDLRHAAMNGDAAAIGRFLAQGGDPNLRRVPHDTSETLLHLAALRRQPAIARMLVAAGALVNTLDRLLASPLVAALDTHLLPAARPPRGRLRVDPATLEVERTTELATLLVLAGANLSGLDRPYGEITGRRRELYRPPLHLAARYGYVDVVRLLLAHGAPADVADAFGNTPLHEALNHGQAEAAALLIAAGADVGRARIQPGSPANTPLLMLVTSHEHSTADKVQLIHALAGAGADPNAANTVGDTPLLAAVRHATDRRYAIIGAEGPGSAVLWQVQDWPVYEKLPAAQVAALIVALLAAGADSLARDRDGKTARDLALAAGLDQVAALL